MLPDEAGQELQLQERAASHANGGLQALSKFDVRDAWAQRYTGFQQFLTYMSPGLVPKAEVRSGLALQTMTP